VGSKNGLDISLIKTADSAHQLLRVRLQDNDVLNTEMISFGFFTYRRQRW